MATKRGRAALMTWLTSVFSTGVTMITGFLITPLVLKHLSDTRYGIARSLLELLAYFALVGQGVTISVAPRLAAGAGRGDRGALARTLAATIRAYGAVSAVCVLLMLLFTPMLPRLIKVEPALYGELYRSWWLALVGLPLGIFALAISLIQIAHRGYVVNAFQAAQGVAAAVLSVVLVRAGWGADGMVLALLLASFGYYGASFLTAAKTYPGLAAEALTARPEADDWAALRAMFGPTFVIMLCTRVGVLSDSIVLSSVLGPDAATVLYVTQRLIGIATVVIGTIGVSVWAGLSEMIARGERDTFNRALVWLTKLTVLIGLSAMLPVIAYNHLFLARWIGPQHDGGRWIVIIATINAITFSLYTTYSMAITCAGRVALLTVPSIVWAVINLAASVLFSKWFGPIGPLLGTLTAIVAVNLWYAPLLVRRVFGTSLARLATAAFLPVACCVPIGVALCAFTAWHRPTGWVGLLTEMSLSALLILVVGSALTLNAEEKAYWNARLLQPLLRRLPGLSRKPAAVEAGGD